MKYSCALMLLLLVAGCSQANSNDNPQPVIPQPESSTQNNLEAPPTPIPATLTDAPDPTLNPNPTPSETVSKIAVNVIPSPSSFALSNVTSQERGGVVVEIAWIAVGDKDSLKHEIPEEVLANSEMLTDKPILVWLVFNITNNSGKGFHLHPRRGTVIVNDETIDLSGYESYTSVDNYFDGTYVSGEKVVGGGIWFGIEQSEVSEINELIIRMHGPHFYEEDVYANEYYIVLDLSEHVVEETPDYLK